jgi:metal-sulfur cluster biosynthetic enzyme
MEREARLMQALADVQDPEFAISVVDMGLIRGLKVDGRTVEVALTLTSTGCPCVDWICEDIERRLLAEPDVDDVRVTLVWDRPWTARDLTARGRRLLHMIGYVTDGGTTRAAEG